MYHEIVKKIGIGGYQSNGFDEATEHARNHKLGKQTQTWENGVVAQIENKTKKTQVYSWFNNISTKDGIVQNTTVFPL